MKMKQPEDNMEMEVMRALNSLKSNKEIGMPDVEQELARLKARMVPYNSTKGQDSQASSPSSKGGLFLRKIAAILVAALMLTGLSYAAVRTSFFTKGWDEGLSDSPQEENLQVSVVNTNQNTPPIGEVGRGSILFQNARLDSIMMQIAQYYKVESRFADEDLRSVRLLFKWHKQHSLDEVLQRLNGFERFQIRREENKLIVEQPQAEHSER